MSTPLSNSPGNNTIDSEPVFQSWSPIPALSSFTYFMTGSGSVQQQVVTIKLRDYIGVDAFSQYTNFRYTIRKNYLSGAFATWLVNFSPDFNFNSGVFTDIESNGLSGNIAFNIRNLNLLVPGYYKANLSFDVYGRKATGSWELIDFYTYNVKLDVYATNSVTFTPSVININHYQDTASPVVPIAMNGPTWKLTGPDKYILSSDDPAVIITSRSVGTELIYEASGTGAKTVNLSLSNFFNTNAAIGSVHLHKSIAVNSNSTVIGSIGINVTLLNEGQFEVNPSELTFDATKGIFEPEEQFVNVFCTSEYSVQSPPWLIVTTDVLGDGNLPGIKVVPLPTASMEGGIYNADIILTAIIDGIPSQINLPVTYTLLGYINLPYIENNFNFTLDGSFVHMHTLNLGTYFDFLLKGTFSNFYTNEVFERIIPLKVPLLKGMQKFNIGEGIHRMMRRADELQIDNPNQYKLAKIGFEIYEKELESGTTVRQLVTDNIYNFVAGPKPKMISNHAILSVNEKPMRVYPHSVQYLNLLIPSGSALLKVLKNGSEVLIRTISTTDNIVSEKLDFFELGAKQGDKFECRLMVGDLYISKFYHVFPEGLEKNIIFWEDNFLLKSVMDFGGKFEIKSEREMKTQVLYKNLAEVLMNLESKKISKITINTGFILETDIESVDELMSAKRAWLQLHGELIDLVPVGKTLVEKDSDRELISFDVEFQINRKYNEKIYSF